LRESGQLILDERKTHHNHDRDHDITLEDFANDLPRIISCETVSPVETRKNKDRFFTKVKKSVPDYSLSKENNNYNIGTRVQKEKKIVSKIQSTDTADDLRSKLLFVRQSSSVKLTCHMCKKTFQQKVGNSSKTLGNSAICNADKIIRV
jgi:hypothetical protein